MSVPKRLILSAMLLAVCEIVNWVESMVNTLGIVDNISLAWEFMTCHTTVKQFEARVGHYGIAIYYVVSTSKSIVVIPGVVYVADGFFGQRTVAVKV